MQKKIKILDVIIIFLAAAAVFFSAYFAYIKPRAMTQVLIQADGSRWFFPVDAKETVVVHGVLGDTIIQIDEGSAWIESSPCDNKTCVAAGRITRQGQWAACLPNNVLLLLYGSKDNEENVDTFAW